MGGFVREADYCGRQVAVRATTPAFAAKRGFEAVVT